MQTHSFSDLGLSGSLIDAVAAEGYTRPTEIQIRAIPPLLAGHDLLGTAQTGTGKTAAFTLPLLQRLQQSQSRLQSREDNHKEGRLSSGSHRNGISPKTRRSDRPARPSALILAPTRELAVQIDRSVAAYGAHSGISHTVVYGGASKSGQQNNLGRRPSILTATPGRLLDFIGEGLIDLSGVDVLIIDEADRMLDMGFIPDVRRIAAMASDRRQTALFAATMPSPIEKLADELLTDSKRVAVAPRQITVDAIRQTVLHLAQENKIELLQQLIRDRNMFRVLVFTRTKHRAARLAKVLKRGGIPSAEIHGNRTQNQRERALENFRSGKVQALVGTDVAARGIDVDDITHVINFEIPHEPETYVHRIGRTARAGTDGEAISMCDSAELQDFRRIEKLLRCEVEIDRDHRYHTEPARDQRSPSRERGSFSRTRPSQQRRNGGKRTGNRRSTSYGNNRGGSRRGENHRTG